MPAKVDPATCTGCAACIDACPVEAIFTEEEVPEEWHAYIAKNYEHFGLEAP